MGLRGPAPTPSDALRARGSRVRAGRRNEPKPKTGIGGPPKRLNKDAAGVWRQVVKDLEEMHVGRRPDRHALERYCRMIVRSWRLAEVVDKLEWAQPIREANKVVDFKVIKLSRELRELEAALLCLEREFGLTPASRTRLHVEKQSGVTKVATRPRIEVPIHDMEHAR